MAKIDRDPATLTILQSQKEPSMAGIDQNPTPLPPWEALHLVAHYLDPRTLAIASCVSRSWLLSLSSDQLWLPLCAADFPSLSSAALSVSPQPSLRRLYAAATAAASRRLRRPPKPRISLRALAFALDVRHGRRSVASVTVNPARDLGSDRAFRFRVGLPPGGGLVVPGDLDEAGIRVSWHVVMEGWGALFSMMDCEGSGRFVAGTAEQAEGWFSKELPAPGCCSSAEAASGLVAELKVGFHAAAGRGEGCCWRAEEVCVGVLNVLSWRYVGVEDALRYLQHFLSPCG